jgi:hypothetical protein
MRRVILGGACLILSLWVAQVLMHVHAMQATLLTRHACPSPCVQAHSRVSTTLWFAASTLMASAGHSPQYLAWLLTGWLSRAALLQSLNISGLHQIRMVVHGVQHSRANSAAPSIFCSRWGSCWQH